MRYSNQQNQKTNLLNLLGKKFLTTTAMTAVGFLSLSIHAHAEDYAPNDFGNHTYDGGSTGSSLNVNVNIANKVTTIDAIGAVVKAKGDGDLKANWTANINQDSSSSIYALYDTEDGEAVINGSINANGHFYVFDKDGVIFGANSQVNVGSIIASSGTLTSSISDLEAGQVKIQSVATDGAVINRGNITVADAGIAAFVAPNVTNSGVITAKMGTVSMAAHTMVTLDMYGDGLVEVAVDNELASGLITNSGKINANGGNVQISAAIAKDAVDNVINLSGVVNGSSAIQKGGKIIISGGNSGRVLVNTALNANGVGDQDGGEISVTGENVFVSTNGRLRTDSESGAAGKIEAIALNNLRINGELTAQGMLDNGFIETSAPATNFGTGASILATREWLLDPTDIEIKTPLATLIEGQLAVGNMTVQTPAGGVGEGDITLFDTIDWATANTLTLNATNDVNISTGGGVNTDGGSFVANAGDDFRMYNANNGVYTNGGDITVTTVDEFTIETGFLSAGGGDIVIDNAEQFQALTDTLQTSGIGTITLNQNKDANDNTATTDATIQNAINAIFNSGTGANTINVGEGAFTEGDINIDKNLLISGAGKNKTIIDATGSANGFVIDTDLGNTNTALRRMTVENAESVGVRVEDTASLKVLTLNQMALNNNGNNGFAIFGDTAREVRILNSDFKDNAELASKNRGQGDILFYLYDGDLTLKNVDVQNENGDVDYEGNTGIAPIADYGIQIIGSNANEASSLPLRSAGEISLDNVSVSGNYRAALLGIQEYSAIENLSMNDVTLGGQTDAGTDSTGFGSLFLSNLGTSDLDLGNTSFDAVDSQYIVLGAGPTYFTTNNVDATGATFEGIAAADLTTEQSFDVEDKIFHKIDFAPQGLVTWQEDNLFVTQASNDFSAGGGIQRGIDASNAGGTLNVAEGTYTEDLVIDKALKLKGYDAVLNSVGGLNLITVTASNVNIDPFTFDGMGVADYGVNASGLGAIGLTVDGNTFKNFNKAGIYVAANGVGTGNIINNTFEGSSTRGVETGKLDGGYTLDITDNIIGSDTNKVNNGVAFGQLSNATINITGGTMDTSGDAITGGNVGSRVALNLTNVDVEAGDEAADFNGNVDGQVTISGGSMVGAGSGFEANFIGRNGALIIKNGAVIEGNSATHGIGLNILRAGIQGSISVIDSIIKGGLTGVGSDGGSMDVTGSLSVAGSSVVGLNGDGIKIDAVKNGATIDISDNNEIKGAHNGVSISDIKEASSVTIGNNDIDGGVNGVTVAGSNPSVDGDAVVNILRNTINNQNVGILAHGISDLDIDRNTVNGSENAVNGIVAQNGGDTSITRNTVSGNTDTGAGRAASNYTTGVGILVNNTEGNVVISRNDTNNNVDGIRVLDTDAAALGDVVISNNDVTNNSDKGIITKNSNNVRVTQNTIDGNKTGIWVETSTGNLVKNNTITNTAENAIRLRNSDVNTVAGNDIDDSQNGVFVESSDNVVVARNEIDDVTNAGVHSQNSNGTEIKSNEINDNGASTFAQYGVLVDNGSDVIVSGNKIEETTVSGVAANDTTSIKITDNLVKDGKDGINVDGGVDATIKGNEIRDMSDDGIQVSSNANVVVKDNVVLRSGDSGVTVYDSENAKIKDNDVDEARNGIRVTQSADVVISNNEIDDASDAGILVSYSNDAQVKSNEINDNGASTFADYGILVEGGNSVDVDDNKIEETSIAGIAANNTTYIDIDDNLVKDGANGIAVSYGYNADARGNTVQDMSGDGVKIFRHANVDIEDNIVNRIGEHGISADRSNNANIDGNRIHDAGYDGINVYGGYGADILSNHIGDVGYDGVDVAYNEFVEIINNEIHDAGDNAIEVEDSYAALIDGNDIDGAGNDGINVETSLLSQINDNDITDVENDGINVSYSAGTSITDNMIYGQATASSFSRRAQSIMGAGRDGIHVEDSSNVVIDGNTVQGDSGFFRKDGLGAGRHGIFVSGGDTRFFGTGVQITNNQILGDSGFLHSSDSVGEDGIRVEDNGAGIFGDAPLISRNTVEKTGDEGVDVSDTSFVNITRNDVTSADGNGIKVADSYGADILNNTVRGSGDDGIDLEDSRYADIRRNNVSLSGDDGISVDNSFAVDMVNNTIMGSAENGIQLSDSAYADIRRNTIIGALGNGISIDDSYGADVINNNISAVFGNGVSVEDSDEVSINRNIIAFARENGIEVDGGYDVRIRKNEIENVLQDGINVTDNEFVRIVENEISNAGDNGIDTLNATNIAVKRNVVDTTGDDGIRIINENIVQERPTFQEGFEVALISSPSQRSRAVIEGNTVSNAGTPFPEVSETTETSEISLSSDFGGNGIEVGGYDNILVEGNAVSNSVENGLKVSGNFNGDVEISDNTFIDNDIGALFESGAIDLAGLGNTFEGGRVGMRFAPLENLIDQEIDSPFEENFEQFEILQERVVGPEPTGLSLVGNTIGAQTFDGQSGNYVELDNGALFEPGSPTLLNALDSTYVGTPFGAVTPSVDFLNGFTAEQVAFFESKFFHFNDNGNTGLFSFPLLPGIDQEDILRFFGPNAAQLSGLNLTILGLPTIPGAAPTALNAIAPAAGGDPTSPETLNAIATAAGDEETQGSQASCYSDAMNIVGGGQAASLSYGGGIDALLNSEANCGS